MNKSIVILLGACLAMASSQAAPKHPKAPKTLRLYIFDCGTIHTTTVDAYSLKKEEVGSTEMAIPCILVAHPKGTLMWDNGDIPDRAFPAGGGPASAGVVTQEKPLLPQLAAVGYTPADITVSRHVALSRRSRGERECFRRVHLAGAESGAGPHVLRRADSAVGPRQLQPLKNSKTVIIDKDEYDVFGDGTVIIKSAPGHTPGHQVLFLKLAKTGPVVLSGDLYHYPEERTLARLPVAEFNKEQTAASRAELEVFLKKTGAQLWIQHDFLGNAKLKKAPEFYE